MAFCAQELRSLPLTWGVQKHNEFLPSVICCTLTLDLRGYLWVELRALVVLPNKLFTSHHFNFLIFPQGYI